MLEQYIRSVGQGLAGMLELLTKITLPLAITLGLGLLALGLALTLGRDRIPAERFDFKALLRHWPGWLAVALCVVASWSALRTIPGAARQEVSWRESAEATANPTPDAPPVHQFGPTVAVLVEKTYTRTLTLPPYFLQRIGTDGIGMLAPYLSDPSAESVIRLRDTFARSGQDVLFTREVTRRDEEPLAFQDSHVRVNFRRLGGRAYDAAFEGTYVFANSGTAPQTVRFVFALPYGSTVRDLSVRVGNQAVAEPGADGAYKWEGELAAGEKREAVISYRALGARTYHYDLGSSRRRVQQFELEATGSGAVRFLRGSLQPTVQNPDGLRWKLENIVTAQQIALAFPLEVEMQEAYLQALNALAVAFIAFLIGLVGLWFAWGGRLKPAVLILALGLFTFGLASAPVIASYLGGPAGILLGPLCGALLVMRTLGRSSLLASVPAALLPGAFLSPRHSGLLILLLILATLATLALVQRRWTERGGGEAGS